MSVMFWLFIVLLIFAFGDILGIKTKGALSSTFIMLIAFLILFLVKVIPADIISQAGLAQVSSIAVCLVMVDMGAMIDVRQLKSEWRTVIVSILAMGCTAIGVLCVMPIIGRESALVSIPIINGAFGSTQVMVSAASEKGFALAAALGTMIYGLQKFVGTVPAAYCGRKYAMQVVADYRENLAKGIDLLDSEIESEASATKKVVFCERFKKYLTAPVLLCMTGALAYLANVVGEVTGVNYTVWCLVFGFVARLIGLLPEKPLTKACSNGFLMVAVFGAIIPSLADITFEDLGTLGLQLVLVFAASLAGIFLFMYVLPLWKLVGSKHLAIGISACQLLGFPVTMIVSREIAQGYSENDRERDYIEKKLMIPYVVSGLVSVTILSVLVASILENYL